MSQSEREIEPGSAVQSALKELQGMIAQRYPSAAFAISRGDDPEGFYLTPTVDVEDTTEVYDVVRERLFELQVDDGLDVYVTPVRPVERVLEEMRERQQRRPHARHPSILDLAPASKIVPR